MTYYAIEKLRNNINIFNGSKIITLSFKNNNFKSEIYDKLIGEFDDITFITVENDGAREANHFFDILLPTIKGLSNIDDYIFYGHNKGCTRPENDLAIQIWVSTLWKYNIEGFDKFIEPEFGKYKFIGCLRRTEPKLAMGNIEIVENYHYAGAFFWFSGAVFKERYDYNNGTRWATEKWPGVMSTFDNSFSVFDRGDGDLYQLNFWLYGNKDYPYLNSEKYKKFKRKYNF